MNSNQQSDIVHIIIGLNYGYGGAELMLLRLIKQMNKQHGSFKHHVVSLTPLGKLSENFINQGISVHALNLKSPLNLILVLIKLVLLLIQIKPCIVQTWMYHSDLIGGIAARIAGISNIVWNIRNTSIPQVGWSRTRLVIRVCAWLSTSIPRSIICCAEASRSSHILAGYDESKMVVIPNGFDLELFKDVSEMRVEARNQLQFDDNLIVIGIVGRFDVLKDYNNFINAAEIIARQRAHVKFLMVGRDIDYSNGRLVSWLQNTGFYERFVLLGERNDVPKLMCAMDIYCLSSCAEGFPNVVAEAMAAHLPCVVTDVGDAALIVQDSGEVVPKRNAILLAAALLLMTDLSRKERQYLGNRSRMIIETSFAINIISDRYMNLYLSILNPSLEFK